MSTGTLNSGARNSEARLNGRVALVTGADGAMGRAEARRLAAMGATVAVTDLALTDRLQDLARDLGGRAYAADLSIPEGAAGLVAAVGAELGAPAILVANHAYMSMGPLVDADPASWWRVIDTNLAGTFRLVRAVAGPMRTAGWGRVVVIASEWGVTGWPEATAYAASKAGLISLVKSLGREFGPDGILVNAIAPGVIDTAQLLVDAENEGIPLEEMHRRYAADIPLGRIGRPEEIAAGVGLLCDPRLTTMMGQTLQINGGSTRGRV